jgi:hypothetical protein
MLPSWLFASLHPATRLFSPLRKKWNDLIWLKYHRPWAGYELLGALSGSPAAIRSNQPLTCRSYCRGREPTKEHCPYLYLLRLGDVRCDSSRLIAGLLIATPTQPNYQHDQAQQPPNSATEQSNLGRTTHISVAGSSQDADQLAQGLLIVGGR